MARKAGPPAQMPFQHYRPFTPIPLPDRTWPSAQCLLQSCATKTLKIMLAIGVVLPG